MINKNILSLPENYIFEKLRQEAANFKVLHPDFELYDLSIGDVCGSLPECAANALVSASSEMKNKSTFRGYGPTEGYEFLREAICNFYNKRGILLNSDELFITEGSKPAISDILSLFSKAISLIIEPTYPVFAEASIMHGFNIFRCYFTNAIQRTPDNVQIQQEIYGKPSLIFLCSPNNPDGYAYSKDELASWVKYAADSGSIILFDAAYEKFISSKNVPHSIFEIEGSKKCAIEFCSFSKFAGFTGLRCGWCVVPKDLILDNYSLNRLYKRALSTTSNGVSYPVQRAAAAVLTDSGLAECVSFVDYYKTNSQLLSDAFAKISSEISGADNSPYLWVKTPNSLSADNFSSKLLRVAQILVTPSSGFCEFSENYVRVSCLCDKETAGKAAHSLLKNASALLDNC